jgi:hypothetical protein
MRTLRNTLAVLLVTALTTIALYALVEIASETPAAASAADASVAAADQTYLCPTTGCSASTCHGAMGIRQTLPGDSAASGAMVCPATGCAASTCHGATGDPPPRSSGGMDGQYGYGRRGYGGGVPRLVY